jgi:hypothetical protein
MVTTSFAGAGQMKRPRLQRLCEQKPASPMAPRHLDQVGVLVARDEEMSAVRIPPRSVSYNWMESPFMPRRTSMGPVAATPHPLRFVAAPPPSATAITIVGST